MKKIILSLIISMFLFGGCLASNSNVQSPFVPDLNFQHKRATIYVDDESWLSCLYDLRELLATARASGIKELDIYMMNGGGNLYVGFAMYEELKRAKDLGLKINTHAAGLIASAGVIIYLVGDSRTAYPSTSWMLHPHSFQNAEGGCSMYGCYEIPESVQKMAQKWTNWYMEILTERTTMPADKIIEIMSEGTTDDVVFFDNEQALEWGILHEIIDATS